MVARGWGAARAGPLALLLAIVLALGPFGGDLELVAFSQTKGALLSVWVLSIIWAALFLFHLVDETGQIPVIGGWLARLAPDRPLQVLLLAWVFTSFLQGIAGYGIPVAVVAPLMVGNGFTPLVGGGAAVAGRSGDVGGAVGAGGCRCVLAGRLRGWCRGSGRDRPVGEGSPAQTGGCTDDVGAVFAIGRCGGVPAGLLRLCSPDRHRAHRQLRCPRRPLPERGAHRVGLPGDGYLAGLGQSCHRLVPDPGALR